MSAAIGLRHQHVHVPAKHLPGTEPENILCAGAEGSDNALLVNGQDRLGGGVKNGSQPRFTVQDRLFRGFLFCHVFYGQQDAFLILRAPQDLACVQDQFATAKIADVQCQIKRFDRGLLRQNVFHQLTQFRCIPLSILDRKQILSNHIGRVRCEHPVKRLADGNYSESVVKHQHRFTHCADNTFGKLPGGGGFALQSLKLRHFGKGHRDAINFAALRAIGKDTADEPSSVIAFDFAFR